MPELLRETFEEYALRAPSAEGLRAGVEARRTRLRTRRRWATAAVAAATAAAVVAGVTVVRAPEPPKLLPSPLATEPPAPAGMRWVMRHGVEVPAPVAWFDFKVEQCGGLQTDAVFPGDTPSVGDCNASTRRDIDVLLFSTEAKGHPHMEVDSDVAVTVSGHPARRRSGREGYGWPIAVGNHLETLLIPDRQIEVVVATDDLALAERILGAARVATGTDSRGCEVRPGTLFAEAPPPARREGADDVMVPGAPVQASVCRYGPGGWAVASAIVDRPAELAAALNDLQPGSGARDPAIRRFSFVVTFRYADGPDVVVYVRRDLGASNGAVAGHGDSLLGGAFRPIVGWQYVFDEARDWYVPATDG